MMRSGKKSQLPIGNWLSVGVIQRFISTFAMSGLPLIRFAIIKRFGLFTIDYNVQCGSFSPAYFILGDFYFGGIYIQLSDK